MYKKTVLFAVVALSAFAAAQSGKLLLQARLSGVGKGKVVWKIDDRAGRSQAQLQLEGERLPRNTAFVVTIDRDTAFMVLTDGLGRYHVAQRYTTPDRPSISAGDSVVVSDGSGATIQWGVMQPG